MKKTTLFLCLFLTFLAAFAQDYKLVWEDNFDKPSLDEVNHWTIEVNGDGGGNNELQYYRRENISIEKHPSGVNCMVISAKKESFNGKLVTSGRLVTRGNVSCKYGKIEARIQLPSTANGLWPAFWMMGDDYSSVGWPRCGEIDILEMGNSGGIAAGTQNRFMNGACHWGEVWTYYAKNSTAPYSIQDGFHLFTLIWDSLSVKMYLDLDKYPANLPYYEMSIAGPDVAGNVAHYFHKPFSILFNLAVGGNFTGITGNANIDKITALATDGTPAKMYVDYVRIYQKGDAGEQFHGPSNVIETTPPTAFTATKGAVTPNSVELLLNATDNSGTIVYEISYNGTVITTKGVSGTPLSYLISGLNASTTYNFSVVAKDLSGNQAANNPILISATTGINYNGFAPLDYETVGNDWTWSSFGNGSNGPELYAVVANPSPSGINMSDHCAKYIINPGAMSWAGIYSDNIGSVTLTPDNCKVKIMVYKSFISNFLLKMENGAANFEKNVPNTKTNQWEELTFDLTPQIGKTITRLVLIPDNSTERTVQRISYWDNISFNSNKVDGISSTLYRNLSVFPNPFRQAVQLSSDQLITEVVVRNLLGEMLKRIPLSRFDGAVDLGDLSNGNYLLEVKSSNGQTTTRKILKVN